MIINKNKHGKYDSKQQDEKVYINKYLQLEIKSDCFCTTVTDSEPSYQKFLTTDCCYTVDFNKQVCI